MGKEKITHKYLFITFIILLVFFTNSHAQQNIIEMPNQNKISFNKYTDTIVRIEGNDVLVRFDAWGSGIVRIIILVYIKPMNKNREWMLLCSSLTNTTKVKIELNQEQKEMIFKTKSGKILIKLPFNFLVFDSDW